MVKLDFYFDFRGGEIGFFFLSFEKQRCPCEIRTPYFNIPAEFELFPARPLDFTPRVRREWKKIA